MDDLLRFIFNNVAEPKIGRATKYFKFCRSRFQCLCKLL